ncbi:MAG: ABC transporter ATP-binding protein, partial [Gammaproteobacteria bacterium]
MTSSTATLKENRSPLLEVSDLRKYFPIKKGIIARTVGQVHAVDGISFSIHRGETLGLVGESGCGKSTVGATVLKLMDPTSGTIKLAGRDITNFGRAQMRPLRREMQLVFQDPFSSLNPRMSAGDIVREPLALHGVTSRKQRNERVAEVFERVGLRPEHVDDFPHQFSGGQRQRIGIARALVLEPSLIVADEPVSALDVSIQAQVINLLMTLQDEYELSYLFIAHDLAVVKHLSHRVAVMYLGRIVEIADKHALFRSP